ncbi:tetratricopeptide repeat protein [Candidatus Albibeggiatoa sp. nov. BB20]|uniref:tetratricopeptide repeat protein n=1 Tax=Candidatus Albibeggiatoa sp. nov. BB20 TaxID=3162723 RepID=UPI0033659828
MTERHYPIVVVNQPRQNYLFPILALVGLLLLLTTVWFGSTWFHAQPQVAVKGIASIYVEGEPIHFMLTWSEGDVMKAVHLEIPDAEIHKIWNTNATRGEKTTRLSTVGWLPIQYTYTATFITKNHKNHMVTGMFQLDKRDIVQPSSQIIGIENNYNVGTEITYTLQAVDNRALQKAIFMVRGTPVEQSWDVNAQQIAYQASFSTKGWEANRHYDYTFTVIDDAGNQFDNSGKFWLIEIDHILPEGQVSGIENKYVIGDKVNYSFNVTDNEELKEVIFKVKPDRVSQIWHTNSANTENQSSFSTENWQAGDYEYQLKILDHVENEKVITGTFTLAEPQPLEMQNKPFTGQLLGIKQAYQIGDTINYSLENYHRDAIKTLLFEVQPNMKETIWHSEELKPVISNSFATTNWQHGVYSYFITAFGHQDEILQRQQGTFTLTQPAQPFKIKVASLLKNCQQHFAAKRYTVGKKGTALACYRRVLRLDANNAEAKKGLKAIEVKYHVFVESALKRERWQSAKLYLSRLADVNPKSTEIKKLKSRLKTLKNQARKRAKQQAKSQPKKQEISKPAPVRKAACPHCDCEELLTKLSIGVEPLTSQEQTYQRAHCQ